MNTQIATPTLGSTVRAGDLISHPNTTEDHPTERVLSRSGGYVRTTYLNARPSPVFDDPTGATYAERSFDEVTWVVYVDVKPDAMPKSISDRLGFLGF